MWVSFKNKVEFHDFTKGLLRAYRKLEKEIIVNGGICPKNDYRKHCENARREFRRKWSLFGK